MLIFINNRTNNESDCELLLQIQGLMLRNM